MDEVIKIISPVFSFIKPVFESLPDFLGDYYNLFIAGLNVAVGAILVLALHRIFVEAWLFYKRSESKKDIKWALFEIRIPREVGKTPRAMEQFLMSVHGLRNAPGDFLETYVEGEVTLWWSLEIISLGGEIHFYIRTPENRKKMIESAFYAQYPTVDIIEVKDYMDDFPKETKEIYKKDYNLFGSELILRKEDVYPITTYERFFEKSEAPKEELTIDPISALIEVLSGINKEENVFIQILLQPAGDEWQKQGKKVIDKLMGKEEKKEKKSGVSDELGLWVRNFMKAPAVLPEWGKKEEKKEEKKKDLTMGEKTVVEALEGSISKPGFNSLIRFIYYAPKSIFSVNFARRGLLGAFNQYASPQLNSFRGNSAVETRARWIDFPHILIPQRVEAKRQRMLYNYRERKLPEESWWGKFFTSDIFNFNFKSKTYILNTAEAATLFHIPGEQVLTAPHIKKMESKKMGPPAGLAIFEDEE